MAKPKGTCVAKQRHCRPKKGNFRKTRPEKALPARAPTPEINPQQPGRQELGDQTVQFLKFPQLPLELREIIWGHAIPHNRLIKVWSYYAKKGGGMVIKFTAVMDGLTNLLLAHREVEFAVKKSLPFELPSLFQKKKIRFRATDVICLMDNFLDSLSLWDPDATKIGKAFENVRTLRVNEGFFAMCFMMRRGQFESFKGCVKIFLHCKSLEEILILVPPFADGEKKLSYPDDFITLGSRKKDGNMVVNRDLLRETAKRLELERYPGWWSNAEYHTTETVKQMGRFGVTLRQIAKGEWKEHGWVCPEMKVLAGTNWWVECC